MVCGNCRPADDDDGCCSLLSTLLLSRRWLRFPFIVVVVVLRMENL